MGVRHSATVSTVASACIVPQLDTVSEMGTRILIKKLTKSMEANVWYTTHQPTSQRLSSHNDGFSSIELVTRVCRKSPVITPWDLETAFSIYLSCLVYH